MYQPFLLRSSRQRFAATSPGERLWFSLRDWWFDAAGDQVGRRGLAGFDWLDGDRRPGEALTNAAISDACVRLARNASKALIAAMAGGDEPAQYREHVVARIKQYCVSPMGMSFADPILPVIANLAFNCAVVSRQSISTKTRGDIDKETRRRIGHVPCYVCGIDLGAKGYPLDHLWPQSLGGVSSEDNLLPVCDECNGLKKDRVSWDVFGVVVDYAFLGQTTEGRRLTDMALHRKAATALAERETVSLKDAFIQLGPAGIRQTITPDVDSAWFFNHTVHDLSVLPQLWT